MLQTHWKKVFACLSLVGMCSLLPFTSLADPIETTYKKLRVFAQILSFVQNNYVDQVDEELLMHDAMRGLLKSLDPHSVYMTPSEYQKRKKTRPAPMVAWVS